MALRGYYDRLTADSGGAATLSVQDNGLITMVHVAPVGAVNAGSTAALKQDFPAASASTVTRTVVAATACNAAVDLWNAEDGNLSITRNRTTKVIIASATQGNQFDVFVDVMTDD